MTTAPIAAIAASPSLDGQAAAGATRTGPQGFAQMLMNGLDRVDQTVRSADAQVAAFALDDSIPPHRVMFALEEAHHALTMMMQVRTRVVEGYQELMRMQL